MRKVLLVPVVVSLWLGCGPQDVSQKIPGTGGGTGSGGSGAGGALGSGGITGSGGGAVVTGSGGSGIGGATTGTGGASTGTGGRAAGGSTGTGGRGAGGAATGTGGTTAGTGGAAAGGSSGTDTADVAADLNMASKWLLPCGIDQSYSLLVCQNNPPQGACQAPSATVPYLTAGTKNLDKTITLRGIPGKTYTVTARVQGVVEPKHYQNGINTTAATCAGAPATDTNCGWYIGGAPQTVGNYNVYMLWVSAPAPNPTAGLTGQYYFLNNINKTEAHFSYPIDYTVTFQVNGGAMVRFLADDSNCSAIKNCDTTSVDTVPGGGGKCNPITVPNLVTTSSGAVTQPYPGQFMVMDVLSVQ